jgi:hypothetical protein
LFPLAARYPGLGTRGSGQFIDILETKNTRKAIIKRYASGIPKFLNQTH